MRKHLLNYSAPLQSSWHASAISILGHLLLIVCFIGINKSPQPEPIHWGNLISQASIISFSPSSTPSISSHPHISQQKYSTRSIHQPSHPHALLPSSQTHPSHQLSSMAAEYAASHGQSAEEVIKLLHQAIQKQQHYPENALQMEREGKVGLKFILFTNGSIARLRITHSSGTTSLDQAALSAIREAAPFVEARPYLKNSEEYSIDVIFELA